jgi:hypothetical protein
VRPTRGELDVEDRASLRRYLQAGDVVVDAAGPFQRRTTALLEAAMERGAHVVDINESLGYARRVAALGARIDEIPVDLDASRRVGASKMRLLPTLVGYWRLFRHRRRVRELVTA